MGFEQVPTGLPPVLTGAIILIGALLTFSERLAESKGLIGSWARWWNNRRVREVEQKLTLDKKIQAVVDEATKQLREDLAVLRADLEAEKQARRVEREDHRRELADAEQALEKAMSWIAVATAWHADHVVWLAAQGIEVSAPLPSWLDWKNNRD